MFTTDRIRRRDRLHLVHHVLARLRGRGWFSSRQVWQAAYWGTNPVHRYTHTRVRGLLSRYVEAGILSRDDDIAACPLYRHRTAGHVDQAIIDKFEAHAQRRWSPAYDVDLKLIDQDLDRLIPRDADPKRFIANGCLIVQGHVVPPKAGKIVPARPSGRLFCHEGVFVS